jgi:FOG: EAL domain
VAGDIDINLTLHTGYVKFFPQKVVLAEGIEDLETARILEEYDCDVAQGYLFSRPLSPDEIPDWLPDSTRSAAPMIIKFINLPTEKFALALNPVTGYKVRK